MYHYISAAPTCTHRYLMPAVMRILEQHSTGRSRCIFDVGCGNGSKADTLASAGYSVTGVDPSEQGIAKANAAFPELDLHVGSAYDDLAARFGRFPFVISLEVIEHLYDPRAFATTIYHLLEPNGIAILSTPYHGYLKNLALAVSGRMDAHFTALWDGGHIKFWSPRTLTTLLQETGFSNIRFIRVGRVPPLAKSMIAVAHKS